MNWWAPRQAEAGRRMDGLQVRLRETHALTYQYPFVWENWRLKDGR